MRSLQFDCPHCLTAKVGFAAVGQVVDIAGANMALCLLQCGNCAEGIVLKAHSNELQYWMIGGQRGLQIIKTYPLAEPPQAPRYVPQNVTSFFLQGLDNVKRRNFDAAGSMFRKVLDAALREIHPEGKGVLAARIEAIPLDKGITPAMRDWAHEIRHLGNDAAHDQDPFTEAEAQSLQGFTELFLTYAFTLPAMAAERKSERLSKPA